MKKNTKKNIVLSMAAGKLALNMQYASAGGLGKTSSSGSALSLNEVGAPLQIITPPNDSGSKNGVLYTQLAQNQRIDFIVDGVQRNHSAVVYLAYSKAAGRADQWIQFSHGQGQLELDVNSIQVLAGLTVHPTEIHPFPGTPLGEQKRKHESIVMPVDLTDLENVGFDGERLYFQSIAVPLDANGELRWDIAQASEVDEIVIDRTSNTNTEVENGKSSGSDDSGSKNNDTGGK